MKTLKNLCILVLIVSAGLKNGIAQNTKTNKKAEKEAAIKKKVDDRHYTFSATYMLPQRGGAKAITDVYYDVKLNKDSLIVYLPYYGQAYFDVPYNGDAGMKFTSTKFSYVVKEKKKGGWEIVMKPSDVKNIEQLTLYVSTDGYASLSINSVNRDFIDYNGYIK